MSFRPNVPDYLAQWQFPELTPEQEIALATLQLPGPAMATWYETLVPLQPLDMFENMLWYLHKRKEKMMLQLFRRRRVPDAIASYAASFLGGRGLEHARERSHHGHGWRQAWRAAWK